jgi:hypothetical protein
MWRYRHMSRHSMPSRPGRAITQSAALAEWVEAVNGDGRFGQWCHDVSTSPSDVLDILKRHADT